MKIKPECKLCGSLNTRFLFQSRNRHGRHLIDANDRFNIFLCRTCGLVFIDKIAIDNNYYEKYYEDKYYDGDAPESGTLMAKAVAGLEIWSLSNKNKFIQKLFDNKRRLKILDVGAGNGKFLSSLPDDRFDKTAIEINKMGAAEASSKGLKVLQKDITEIDFEKEKFDVITLWHVLEHLKNPLEVIKKSASLLSENGKIIVATPNTDSLGFTIGKDLWFQLDSPRHLSLFNLKSIQFLAGRASLEISECFGEWYDFPLDLFWSVKNSYWKYPIYTMYPFIKLFDKEAFTLILQKTNNGH